jgi:hypothetical protein
MNAENLMQMETLMQNWKTSDYRFWPALLLAPLVGENIQKFVPFGHQNLTSRNLPQNWTSARKLTWCLSSFAPTKT